MQREDKDLVGTLVEAIRQEIENMTTQVNAGTLDVAKTLEPLKGIEGSLDNIEDKLSKLVDHGDTLRYILDRLVNTIHERGTETCRQLADLCEAIHQAPDRR
jgi:hypothetical protein